MISERPPFKEWSPEPGKIPAGFETNVGDVVHAYQLSVYLDIAKGTYGLAVSEKVRTHILLLSSFDATLESQLPRLFEAFRAGVAIHDPDMFAHLAGDPAVKFHISLAASVMYTSDWPEERKSELLVPLAKWLDIGGYWAEKVFRPELATAVQVADTFQWSGAPGPFERQLQRQQNNPLYPATMRTISAHQTAEARIADLKDAASFLILYRPIERELVSLPGQWTVGQAGDLLKKTIDLIPQCIAAGDYFLKELEVLSVASDAIQQEILAKTKETRLQDSFDQYMALAQIQGHSRALSLALPADDGDGDQVMRSILPEECDTITNYAHMLGFTDILSDNPLAFAQGIINEAISRGLDPAIGQTKLAAFRSGLEASKASASS